MGMLNVCVMSKHGSNFCIIDFTIGPRCSPKQTRKCTYQPLFFDNKLFYSLIFPSLETYSIMLCYRMGIVYRVDKGTSVCIAHLDFFFVIVVKRFPWTLPWTTDTIFLKIHIFAIITYYLGYYLA